MNPRRLAAGLSLGLVLLVLAGRAEAQDLVAGWEGQARRGYAFVAPGFEADLGNQQRLAVRVTGSYLYYAFPELGESTQVRSPGGGISIGYRVTRPRLVFTVSPGIELRSTTRETSNGREQRREFGGTVQADVFARMADRVRGSWIGSYGHANRYVWTRAGILYELTAPGATPPVRVAIGGEVTAQGNKDTRTAQAGTVLDLFLTPAGASLQIRGGISSVRDEGTAVYLGVGLYRRF